MSDLQRSFARAQLHKLPPEASAVFDERDEQDVEDEATELPSPHYDSSSSTSSTGTVVPTPSKNLFERPQATKTKNSPLPWQDFFTRDLYFDCSTSEAHVRHHAYLTPPSGEGPLIVTHHGAGSSGLSFAAFTRAIIKALPDAGVLSLDARGHGQTIVAPVSSEDGFAEPELDLSLETLAADLAFVVESTKSELSWKILPPILLLGHSLGGAVVTEVAYKQLLGKNAILGYGVIDVVEGSAMDALQSMESYLSTRPRMFPSIASGIEWHIRSRTIRNSTSARVSVPPLLIESPSQSNSEPTDPTYTWRTPLAPTKPFWTTWFTGLSHKFLSAPGGPGKLLLLAGTDRLDKELMIGQMQGKFQLQIFPEAGHFVHEDAPEKVAATVADFHRRNDRGSLVLPMKVDDMIKKGIIKPSKSS